MYVPGTRTQKLFFLFCSLLNHRKRSLSWGTGDWPTAAAATPPTVPIACLHMALNMEMTQWRAANGAINRANVKCWLSSENQRPHYMRHIRIWKGTHHEQQHWVDSVAACDPSWEVLCSPPPAVTRSLRARNTPGCSFSTAWPLDPLPLHLSSISIVMFSKNSFASGTCSRIQMYTFRCYVWCFFCLTWWFLLFCLNCGSQDRWLFLHVLIVSLV